MSSALSFIGGPIGALTLFIGITLAAGVFVLTNQLTPSATIDRNIREGKIGRIALEAQIDGVLNKKLITVAEATEFRNRIRT